MVKKYNKTIFIFRRDFRLDDNNGLIEALKESTEVVPIFIFTPEQLVNNKYKSDNCVQFMMKSLDSLDKELNKKKSKLFYFFGTPNLELDKIIKKVNADAVFVNKDYTKYSMIRDDKLEKACNKNKIDFVSIEDYLLYPVGSIRTGNDTVYVKFTPFYEASKKIKVQESIKNTYSNYYKKTNKIVGEFKSKNKDKFYNYNEDLAVKGGRDNAIKILKNINDFKKYNTERNILNSNTTRLSAYIKFGCVSIREVYGVFKSKLGLQNDLIKQLHWRDFYYNVSYFNPHTLGELNTNRNFKKKYSKVKWITLDKASSKQKKLWKAWIEGKTGFPSVDSCMRELNTTGFMHNRGRLIVASFLTKNMMWSWADGEKYFASKLVDYDPNVNNGNWQWVSGSGVDSQPYFRIFNAWTQGEKFDPDCKYIKKWIPELKDVPAKHIHKWNEHHKEYKVKYPEPVLDHSDTREIAIKKYKKALT